LVAELLASLGGVDRHRGVAQRLLRGVGDLILARFDDVAAGRALLHVFRGRGGWRVAVVDLAVLVDPAVGLRTGARGEQRCERSKPATRHPRSSPSPGPWRGLDSTRPPRGPPAGPRGCGKLHAAYPLAPLTRGEQAQAAMPL